MIVCFGGGKWQELAISEALLQGYKLAIVEQNPSHDVLNFGVPIVRKSFDDMAGIYAELEKYTDKIEQVVAFNSDVGLLAAANFRSFIGLEGNSVEAISVLTNKIEQREIFSSCGEFFNPGWQKISNLSEIQGSFQGKVAIKKAISAGSRDVFIGDIRVDSDFAKTISGKLESSNQSDWIIEPYIDGIEYTCEASYENGKLEIFTILKKEKQKALSKSQTN